MWVHLLHHRAVPVHGVGQVKLPNGATRSGPETVELPIKEYLQLVEDSRTMVELDRAGVDSWEGYGGEAFGKIEDYIDSLSEYLNSDTD